MIFSFAQRFLSVLVAAVVAMTVASCGGGDTFEIAGRIDGYSNRPVEVIYMTDGGQFVRETPVTDVNGIFRVTGMAADPTAVEVFIPGEGCIALLTASNGDKVEFKYNTREGKLEVKGNKPSKLLAQWMTANYPALVAHDEKTINASIAQFVVVHPDSPAAAALLLTMYNIRGHEVTADSLRTLLQKDALSPLLASHGALLQQQINAGAQALTDRITFKSVGDTLVTWYSTSRRVTFMAFEEGRYYPGRDTLRNLHRDLPRGRARVMEVFLVPDSAQWRRMLQGDSARWERLWIPGMTGSRVLSNVAPAATPFYLVVDSAGTQLYRGADIAAAARATRAAVKNK